MEKMRLLVQWVLLSHFVMSGISVSDVTGVSTENWQDDDTCGRDLFCGCEPRFQAMNPELCKATTEQCKNSFCSPLCLRKAWEPHITVDCDAVPNWVGCTRFQEEMKHVERAITAQFQAFVCSTETKCCTNMTRLVDWVEGHVFGDQYPQSLLPTESCRQASSRSEHMKSETCALCDRAVRVSLDLSPARCLPSGGKLRDVAPLSLHERCLFLSDKLGSMQHELLRKLRKQVCSCAGCCQGECFFREREHDWLESIINKVNDDFMNRRQGL
eukprot:g789.t1